LHIEKSNPSGNVDFLAKNSGTTSSSNTRIMSFVSGASGGDPSIGVGITGVQDYFWRIDNDDSDKLKLDSNGTTRMTIDSSGHVTVGKTTTSEAVDGTSILSYGQTIMTRAAGYPLVVRVTGSATLVAFKSDSTIRGSISTDGSSTSYNTTSDHRLKENVTGITDGIERVKQLNPSRFNFISNPNRTVDGFIAHEAQAIVPEAITGEKDAMRDEEYEVTPAVLDDDGNVVTEAVMGTHSVPDYQGIDQAKLVPLLTAALQEAITKIEDLEARVATLEGN
jgi:hypothetical protein